MVERVSDPPRLAFGANFARHADETKTILNRLNFELFR